MVLWIMVFELLCLLGSLLHEIVSNPLFSKQVQSLAVTSCGVCCLVHISTQEKRSIFRRPPAELTEESKDQTHSFLAGDEASIRDCD